MPRVETASFDGIDVFAILEMGRFYPLCCGSESVTYTTARQLSYIAAKRSLRFLAFQIVIYGSHCVICVIELHFFPGRCTIHPNMEYVKFSGLWP